MSLPTILDTWWEPSDTQIAAAKAAGYVGWSGYFSFGADRIYHGWADATFKRVLAHGMQTFAYVSGWAPAGLASSRAKALGIRALLDVETTVRPDGGWVDPWLAASPGVGLYGSGTTLQAHAGHGHPGYQIGFYPGGDPGTNWPAANGIPGGPTAWQFSDRLVIPGIGTVDGSHFGTGWNNTVVAAVTTEEEDMLIVNTGTAEGSWLLSGSMYVHIDDGMVLTNLVATGVKQWTIDAGMHELLKAASESAASAGSPPIVAGTVPVTGSLTFG